MLLMRSERMFWCILTPAIDCSPLPQDYDAAKTVPSLKFDNFVLKSEHYQSHFNYLFWEKAKQLAISWSVFAAHSMSRCTYSLPSLTRAQIKYGGRRKTSGGSCGVVERFCLQMWTGSSADLHWRIIGVVMTGDSKASNGSVKLSESDERRPHNENSCS